MKYEVRIMYKGQNNYIVEAEDEEDASMKACECYRSGDNGETFGNEWESIENIKVDKVGE